MSADISVTIDGKLQKYEQAPVIREGNTLAPLRAIFESMGATVDWDASTQTATGRKGGTSVSLRVGERKVIKNGQTIELEVPAQLINGYTMAPARFIGEAFGGVLDWDSKARKVIIKTSTTTSMLHDSQAPVSSASMLLNQHDQRSETVTTSLSDRLVAAFLLTWKNVIMAVS